MVKQTQQAVEKGGFLPMVLTIVGFFLFLGIVVYFWFDNRPATVAKGGPTREERVEVLRELQTREDESLNQYGWIDQDQGIVRLPIERGMELVLEEMSQGQSQN